MMANVNIRSENQFGGITAQNVNAGGGNQLSVTRGDQAGPQESGVRKAFWWIFGILGALGAIAAIIAVLLQGD